MQDGIPVIANCCPHCGGEIWRVEYVEAEKVRLVCDYCACKVPTFDRVSDASAKQDIRPEGLHAGIHAPASPERE